MTIHHRDAVRVGVGVCIRKFRIKVIYITDAVKIESRSQKMQRRKYLTLILTLPGGCDEEDEIL